MKLYYMPGASSLAVHIILRESGLDFSIEKVSFFTKLTEHGEDFLTINPKGKVPALLLDDGTLLTEVVAIVQYLGDRVPDRHLIPAPGTLSRYQALEWLNYVASELHQGLNSLFDNQIPQDYQIQLRQQMEVKLLYLDRELAGQDYLLGNRFSVADAYLFTMLTWTERLGFDLGTSPMVARFYRHIHDRPAVAAALAAEHQEAQAQAM
ncbi:glutathione transferase GstA [Martelella alba]|uniref:Glutathione transferase GstA n=1 Tax=Martelella alba TaxID=2590451 RepID=A0ABY2SK51_9HYPH|nr:glutathione transferase GstA [Martelella alba]TKI05656.1 glutathione transferase GstA [Martelella alba]